MNNNDRLARIKLLAMDIDGTLTDGGLTFHNGLQIKEFNVYDGLGIRLAQANDLKIAWITGNISDTVTDRAKNLDLEDVCQGIRDKSRALQDLAEKYDLSLDQVAYIGDDLNDYPAFETAGYSFAVNNAVDEIKAISDTVTARAGGYGAVREAIEIILKARGDWDCLIRRFVEQLKTPASSVKKKDIA